ncbi:MAG: DUF3313 domain-containing protein [Thermodesulfobacteriota bacterium]|nr:DUF3313 domain-containing protein [Thermodesulfobacteriota bacterium]
MKTTLKIVLILMIGLTFAMTTGCATNSGLRASGFLKDYSKLGKDPDDFAKRVYIGKDVAFGAYDKVIVDHVTLFLAEDAEYKGIDPVELTELAQYFHNAVIEALSGAYSFTDKPGPGTLRVRIAITDLVPNKPVSGSITSIVPVGLAASHLKKAGTGTHIGMGRAAFEAEALDSQTNEVLAAVSDSQTGKKYRVTKSFTTWGQSKEIFNGWAQHFRKRLDKLSGRH